MTDNKYKKAIDKVRFDENLDKRIIDYLSNNISDLEEKSDKHKSKKKMLIPAFVVIAFVLVLKFTDVNTNNKSDFDLPNSTENASVSYIDSLPETNTSIKQDLVWLTEDEIFHERNTEIFKGQITDIKNIEMDFDGMIEYRSIVKIMIDTVYRGEVTEGETVSILVPTAIYITPTKWVEDTGVVSSMREGMTGIFMPIKYNEDSYIEMNNARIQLQDLTEYGFFDGERYAFLETEEDLIFARWAFESIESANSLEEIEEYISAQLQLQEVIIEEGVDNAVEGEQEMEIENAAELRSFLDGLDYFPYTSDGLPEYSITFDDGTIYDINLTSRWVWKGAEEEAVLTEDLLQELQSLLQID